MDTHKIKIIGGTGYEEYYFWEYGCKVKSHYKFVEEVVLFEGELDSPLLRCGDKLYINERNLTIIVNEVIRSTDTGYIYKTHAVDIIIENEETEKSRIAAEEEKSKFIQMKNAEKDNQPEEEMKGLWKRLFSKVLK